MKTYKNLYKKLLDKEHIKTVLLDVSARKKYRDRVRKKIDKMTDAIYDALEAMSAPMFPVTKKTVPDRKKMREITISRFFPNKAFDYLLVDQLKPIIIKSMYHWCVGNVKGRGLDMCLGFCERAVHEYKYCLQLDIKKFYDRIDKAILFRQVARKVADRDFMNFYRQVIGNRGRGLPLGLNSSQWLSNFYLQGFDFYVKQELHAPSYIRYVDNIWIFANNKRKLHYYKKQISKYLSEELHLSLKENCQLLNLEKGDEIDVLGYKVSRGFTRLNKPVLYKVTRLYHRMKKRMSVRRARSIVSLMGWLKRTTNYRRFVKKRLEAPTKIKFKTITREIGRERRRAEHWRNSRQELCRNAS